MSCVKFTELPKMAAAANVLIMPYADLPVTRAMQPLKLKEYMATGRPVVASSLPAVKPWAEHVNVVSSRTEFVEATRRFFGTRQKKSLNRNGLQHLLVNETWAQKSRCLEEMMAN